MRNLLRWLDGELLRVRGVAVKRAHGVAAGVLIVGAVVLVFALGVFVGFHYPYRTVPAPRIPPGQTAPSSNCRHVMGGCLPKPTVENQASITATNQGPDLSNNNPVSCSQMAAIAAHNAFVILKVNEAGYVDRMAAGMAICARAHGLTVGGYDFLHVCLNDPAWEAHVFLAHLADDGLVGPGSLPGVGDVEWPQHPQCNVRSWLLTWLAVVKAGDRGREPMLYSGAWWWNPHVGAWWPNPALGWVSGYVPFPPPIPAGLAHLDIWQFSDHGWNGATTSDLSVWRDGVPAFLAVTGAPAPKPVDRYAIYLHSRTRIGKLVLVEARTVKHWDGLQCRNPVRRPACKVARAHLVLLRDRIDRVAHRGAHVNYRTANRGRRRAGINRRLRAR